MTKAKNIGSIRKIILKLLHKAQITLVKDEKYIDLYYKLTKWHFKLYFKKDLMIEHANKSREYEAAADRHGKMVVENVFPHALDKKRIYMAAKRAFDKNLTLDTYL